MAGSVDRLDNFGMAAWACSDDRKRPCRIRLDVEGIPTYVYIPSDFRPDLARDKWADGFCSVDINFPKIIGLQESVRVDVWNEDTGELLSRGTTVLRPAVDLSSKYRFEKPKSAASASPISAEYKDETWVIQGRAVYPSHSQLVPELLHGITGTLSFEQQEPEAEIGTSSDLVVRKFVLRARAKTPGDYLIFRIAPREFDGKRSAFAGFVAVPPALSDLGASPAYENMSRVSGAGVNSEMFVAAGLTTAAKLDGVARTFAGKSLGQFKCILDWGAGVGRVAKHVHNYFAPNVEFWCIDVDQVNIDEAKKFVPRAICSPIPYYPPTHLEAGKFDLIYGISVFTHLSECAQEVWLQELKRISRRDALLVMSANTEFAALHFASQNGSCIRDLLLLGISDHLLDGNLGNKLDRTTYYRSTYHLTEYIRREWGKHFEILDIVPRADVHVQDLVVMRRL